MILGIKKKNFIIYIIVLFIGIVCIVCSYFCNEILKDLLSNIGWGFVPSIITAYLIDRVNIQNDNKRKNDVRTYFLKGLTVNSVFLAKNIINEFYDGDEVNESLYNVCKKTIEDYIDLEFKNKNIEIETKENKESKRHIIAQVLGCKEKACEIDKDISKLMINEILNENEIAHIRSFIMVCNEISVNTNLIDFADKLGEMIEYLYSIKEIKSIFDKKIKMKNNKALEINKILN